MGGGKDPPSGMLYRMVAEAESGHYWQEMCVLTLEECKAVAEKREGAPLTFEPGPNGLMLGRGSFLSYYAYPAGADAVESRKPGPSRAPYAG